MRKILRVWAVCLLLLVALATPAFAIDQTYTEWPAQKDVQVNKAWSIKLNAPVLASTVTDQNIYVVDNSGQHQNVTVSLAADTKTIQVIPLENYKLGASYTLYILKTVASAAPNSIALKSSLRMQFTVTSTGDTPSTHLFGLVRQISADEGSVFVDVAGKGQNLKYNYNDSWDGSANSSLVMFDASGTVQPIAEGNLIVDQIWSYQSSGIKCSNSSEVLRQIDSSAIIAKIAQNGDYLGLGQLSDLATAADNGKNIRALLDPDSHKIKVLVIEQ